MKSPCTATIVLVAIFVAAASASSETTKRLRTRTIYKSHAGSARSSNISSSGNSNNQNDANKAIGNEHYFLDIPVSKLKAEKQRQRQLIQNILQFGSLSIPIVSFSFSIHIPAAVGIGPISVAGGGEEQQSSESSEADTSPTIVTVEPLETTPTITEIPTTDEEVYDPSLGMESISMSSMSIIMDTSMSMGMASRAPSVAPLTSFQPTPFDDNNVAPMMLCNLCPNGLTVSEDYILEKAGGSTCGMALDYAATLEDTSDQCNELKFSAFDCCPSQPTVSCDFCKSSNGVISVGEDTIIPDSDGTTCGMAAMYAGEIEGNSEICTTLQLAESTCCPTDSTGPAVPCDYCKSSNGITAEDDFAISYLEGVTCGMVATYVTSLDGTSDDCVNLQFTESTCCPDELLGQPGGDGGLCEFCTATGVTVGDDFVIPSSDGATCGIVGLYATTLAGGTEDCANVQFTEAICCPAFEESCSFCSSDGLTVDPNTPLSVDGATCETAFGYALTVSSEDPICSTVQVAEDICCPVGVVETASMSMSMSMSMDSMDMTNAPSKDPTTPSPTKRPVADTPSLVEDTTSPTAAPTGSLPVPSPTNETPVTPPTSPEPPTPPTPKSPPSSGVRFSLSSIVVLIIGIAGMHFL